MNKNKMKDTFNRIDTKEIVHDVVENNFNPELKNFQNMINTKEFSKKMSKNNLMDEVDYKAIKITKEKNKENINEYLND